MNIPDVKFEAPLIIKTGGVYTGNYKSTDPSVPAVWIWTSEKVELKDMVIVAAGNGIHSEGGGNMNIHDCKIFGVFANDKNKIKGRAIYSYQPQTFIIKNVYAESTGGGFFLEQTNKDYPATNIEISYCQLKNMDKRNGNNVNGSEHKAGIMFSSIKNVRKASIHHNEIINEAGNSSVEDLINMFNSRGLPDSYIDIYDNYLDGAYPFPLTADSYTGSGFTIDGSPDNNTLETVSAYIRFHDNHVVRTCNAAFNIAAGHDNQIYNNTAISSGKYPDGTPSWRFWGGCCIYNNNVPADVFVNNSIKGNTIGYVRIGMNAPFPDRQDWVVDPSTPIEKAVKSTDNLSLPNPITKELEDAEYPKFLAKLGSSTITSTTSSTTTTLYPKYRIGDVLKGSISVLDDVDAASTYKAGSIKITGDSLVKVTQDAKDETKFTIEILKEGTSTITVTLTTNNNNTLSEKASVTSEIVRPQEAKKIIITITK